MNVNPVEFSSKKLNESLASYTMNNVSEAVMFTDKYHRIIYINRKFTEITGYTFSDVYSKTPQSLESDISELKFYSKMQDTIQDTGYWQGEIWNYHNQDDIYVQSITIEATRDEQGKVEHYVIVFSDLIDNEMVHNSQYHSNNYYDRLTSLPNRMLFEKRLISSINQLKGTSQSIAVVFFQFKDFFEINEQYGFLFGDLILKRVAMRLNQNTYNNFMVTRWSGTEFACILENVIDRTDMEQKIEEIRMKIAIPIIINGMEVSLKAHFGVHTYSDTSISVADFLSKANTALEKAKEDSEIITFYDESMGQYEKFFIMELELKKAIKEDQFELYYQPLISVDTGALKGFEGLIRWVHPTEGIISPIRFIPLAEQSGMIQEIGDIVFEKACKQIVEWRNKGYDNVKIHINISMNQFVNNDLVTNMKRILLKTNVSPQDIGIELTESSIIVNMEDTINKLQEMKQLGLSIAIDDFGTGYSSFGYLIDFPVQRIKIDRSYMKTIGTNNKITAIVTAISHMGKIMDVEVVAEGIETTEQLECARKLKCTIVQGYLFDKPLPKNEAETKWLKTTKQ